MAIDDKTVHLPYLSAVGSVLWYLYGLWVNRRTKISVMWDIPRVKWFTSSCYALGISYALSDIT